MAPEAESSVPVSTTQSEEPPLSKSALKRALKRKRWEESKDSRKASKKAKLKEKKEKMKLAGQPLKRRKLMVEGQEESGIKVVVDCSFDHLMTDKEITSMSSQLTRCHAENRRSQKTVELYMTSLSGQLGERMETTLGGVHHKWKGVYISTDGYQDVLSEVPRENLVYLTADSSDVIQTLENDKVYIIGGLVDRNRYKNLCYDKAVKEGIKHGRLPIGDYIKMASRHVLTVNQVLEIMLRWLEVKDWERAFLSVIPKRKLQEGQENKDDGAAEIDEVPQEEEFEESDGLEQEGTDEEIEEGNKPTEDIFSELPKQDDTK